jgi:hypothetical protein
MRKITTMVFALFAVCAFCALSASAAFAESEWLFKGLPIEGAAGLEAETEGEITLIKYAETGSETVLNELLCSGIFDGFVGPLNLDRVTDLLSLEHLLEIGELGSSGMEESLDCEVMFDAGSLLDCKSGTFALLWVDNLNLLTEDWWNTEITLSGGVFLDDFTSNLSGLFPGYDVECESLLGIRGSELCEGLVTADLENDAGGSVLGTFLPTPVAERGTCSSTGARSADITGMGDTWVTEGQLNRLTPLTVS